MLLPRSSTRCSSTGWQRGSTLRCTPANTPSPSPSWTFTDSRWASLLYLALILFRTGWMQTEHLIPPLIPFCRISERLQDNHSLDMQMRHKELYQMFVLMCVCVCVCVCLCLCGNNRIWPSTALSSFASIMQTSTCSSSSTGSCSGKNRWVNITPVGSTQAFPPKCSVHTTLAFTKYLCANDSKRSNKHGASSSRPDSQLYVKIDSKL